MSQPYPPNGPQPHPQHRPGGHQQPGGYPPPQQRPYAHNAYQQPVPHYQPPAAPPAAQKKTRKWPWIVGGVVALIVVIGIANGGNSPTTGNIATPAAGEQAPAADVAGSAVVYEVTGPARATNVTYTKEGFQMEQVADADLPFRKELQWQDDVNQFSGLSLVAQNGGRSGDITCRILVDGVEVASSTSSGQYAVVTCTGVNI